MLSNFAGRKRQKEGVSADSSMITLESDEDSADEEDQGKG